MKLKDVVKPLRALAPENTAESWDNVGLQVGNNKDEINKVLLTLDVTEEVIEEASKKKCELVISHHPIIFKPLKNLDSSNLVPRILQRAIKAEVAIYSAHTNLDLAEGGVNYALARALGIENNKSKGLVPLGYKEFFKAVIYVPPEAVSDVTKVLWDGGAGQIGNYDHCLYEIEGRGQFRPLEGTDPYKGTRGEDTKISEKRLETIVSFKDYPSLIEKVKKVHPYEEPVIDIFPLQYPKRSNYMGAVYALETPTTLDTLKESWGKKAIFLGDAKKSIRKLALLGGSGSMGLEYAVKNRVDLYVTGELDYHELILLKEEGISVLLLGHGASEAPVLEVLKELLPVESEISQTPYLTTF
ncbi:MAG: Nif3-like dinuclear metal center hexameric protein [Firmicutes bacterium]|nr:Nif3-like dinuclear metal center hexameric protein [Bacillota bacterium]